MVYIPIKMPGKTCLGRHPLRLARKAHAHLTEVRKLLQVFLGNMHEFRLQRSSFDVLHVTCDWAALPILERMASGSHGTMRKQIFAQAILERQEDHCNRLTLSTGSGRASDSFLVIPELEDGVSAIVDCVALSLVST